MLNCKYCHYIASFWGFKIGILFLLVIFFLPIAVWSSEYDIGGGNNNYSSLSVLLSEENLVAGDVVNIYPGIYTDEFIISGVKGTSANPVIIQGVDNKGNPILTPQETVVFDYENSIAAQPIQLGTSSEWLIIKGLCVRNVPSVTGGSSAITVWSVGEIRIQHCFFRNNVASFTAKPGTETIYVEQCEFSGGYGTHPPYNFHQIYSLGAKHLIIQFCYFHGYDSYAGSVVKVRDINVEFLYNYVEMGSAQNAFDRDFYEKDLTIAQDSLIMGNVFLKSENQNDYTGSVIKRNTERSGNTIVVKNTFIDNNGCISRIIQLESGSGSINEISNNIFTGKTVKIATTDNSSLLKGNNNWIVTGADLGASDFTGTIQGADPGFNASTKPTFQLSSFYNVETRLIIGSPIDSGAYEFAVTAIDTAGNESGFSNIVSKTMPFASIAPSSALISNLYVASGKAYEVIDDGLADGAKAFLDQNFTFSEIPDGLMNAVYIQTAYSDNAVVDNNFLSFDLNKEASVYVVRDARIKTADPAWLSSFSVASEIVKIYGNRMKLYKKDYAAGQITLGGNEADFIMYSVIILDK